MSNQLIGFCKDRIQARRQILTDQMFFVCVCVYRLYGMIVSYLGSCFRLYGYTLGRCIESTSNLKANNTMLLTWHTHFKVYSVYTDETVYNQKWCWNLPATYNSHSFWCALWVFSYFFEVSSSIRFLRSIFLFGRSIQSNLLFHNVSQSLSTQLHLLRVKRLSILRAEKYHKSRLLSLAHASGNTGWIVLHAVGACIFAPSNSSDAFSLFWQWMYSNWTAQTICTSCRILCASTKSNCT